MKFLKKLYEIYVDACNKYTKGGTVLWEPSTIILVVIWAVSTALTFILTQKVVPEIDGDIGGKVNTRTTQKPLPIVYGRQRVASNDVYGFTNGNEDRDLYLVMSLAEGECDSIYQLGGVDQVWLGDKLYNEYEGKVSYSFHNGSDSQTYDTTLHNLDSNWTDNMRNTCYITMKLEWDKDLFRGIPERSIDLKGVKCYNFITEVTEWTDNPALCLYDFFTNTRYGIGLNASQIDTTSWTTAKNYCDHKNFTLNMIISKNDNSWKIIQTILTHFRGSVNYWDGKYYLNYADILDDTYKELSVMTIKDEHIYQDTSGKASIRVTQPSRFNKPSGLRVMFVDAEKNYTTDNIIVGDPTGMVSDFSLEGCIDREMASNLGTSQLERLQLDRTISGLFRDSCVELETNDIVTFNSSTVGIEDQKMRVISNTIQQDGLISLTLQYESYDIYNDDYDLELEDEYICSLPDPNEEPPGVANSYVLEVLEDYRLRSKTKLVVYFDKPSNYAWYDHVEVWLTTTTSGVTSDFYHDKNVTTGFEINNVEDGKDYWVLLRVVNTWGVRQSLEHSSKLHKTVLGVVDSPQSLTYLSAIVNDSSTINFHSNKLNDPDIEVYEFRLGGTWTGGVFLASVRSPNYSLTGVKPGIFDFTANTRGTTDLYGIIPQAASAIIYVPMGWSVYDNSTYTDDYTVISGTNIEQTLYGGNPYLKCSHDSGVLTGTYYSPVFDLGVGNDDRYYVYIDADIIVSGAGATWGGVTSSGADTWQDVNATITTWNDLFEIEEAPSVSLTLYYKENIVDDWSEAARMEICSTDITVRYFQVKIIITDPIPAVNALVEEFTIILYS